MIIIIIIIIIMIIHFYSASYIKYSKALYMSYKKYERFNYN